MSNPTNTPYHLRRKDKAITDENELYEIIDRQNFMTLAMCNNNEPYLVSLDYIFDFDQNCFYFHCASGGKKIDFLTANPAVYGQVVEDLGYIQGECNRAYRSVNFRGNFEWIQETEEKRMVLTMMIDHLEEEPEPVKKKLIKDKSLKTVNVGKINIIEMTGKKYDILADKPE